MDNEDMLTSARLQEMYTPKGLEDLQNLLKTYIRLFNENKEWNTELIILGFGKVKIADREECFGRILGLSTILFTPVRLSKIEKDGILDYLVEM
jgi:hypothetical protein